LSEIQEEETESERQTTFVRPTVETAKEQEARLRQASPFGKLKSWKLIRMIVKANDDVR